jgi:hypothetical protein
VKRLQILRHRSRRPAADQPSERSWQTSLTRIGIAAHSLVIPLRSVSGCCYSFQHELPSAKWGARGANNGSRERSRAKGRHGHRHVSGDDGGTPGELPDRCARIDDTVPHPGPKGIDGGPGPKTGDFTPRSAGGRFLAHRQRAGNGVWHLSSGALATDEGSRPVGRMVDSAASAP